MNLTVALALALALVAVLGGGVLLIRRAGKRAAEGEQAKEGLKVERRLKDVPQPLPGQTEDALRKGEF